MKKDTVVEQAYTILKDQIVTLKLRPGQILMVQQLAIELGFSRTPVREALIRLKEELFVTEAEGNKFKVSDISWKWIQDNYMARIILEEAAINHAAQHATRDQIRQLKKIVKEMEAVLKTMDYAAYFELDCLFHKSIVAISGNAILINWVEQTSDHQQRIRYCTMGQSSEMERSLVEHADMVRYIEEKNFTAACTVSTAHLERALKEMMKLRESFTWLS